MITNNRICRAYPGFSGSPKKLLLLVVIYGPLDRPVHCILGLSVLYKMSPATELDIKLFTFLKQAQHMDV